MATVEFFKQQAKNLLKDYNTKVFNEDEGFYVYTPRFFHDIDDIIMSFDIEEVSFTLMKAQHVIARLAGFYKWTELIKASELNLEIGKLLLTNRDICRQEQGLYDDTICYLIMSNWKTYEKTHLKNADNKAKLEIFKKVFLEKKSIENNKIMVTVDFTNDINAQDMLSKIMKKKKLTKGEAILSSITEENCFSILSTGWAGIAVSLWGHADPDAERQKISNPKVTITLNKYKACLLVTVMKKGKITLPTAIQYFMIFTLESLGYHI